MYRLLPTIDRQLLGLVGITVVVAIAAVYYGGGFLVVDALVLAALTVACLVTGYRLEIRLRADRAEREAAEAKLVEQAAETRAALPSVPSIEDLAREARTAIAARNDLVTLGLACPSGCEGCDQERRESEARDRAFLAERAARHGHARTLDTL